MEARLLHVFCQSPAGSEALRQAVHFCSRIDAALTVYLPVSDKFLIYFENDVVQVSLVKACAIPRPTARASIAAAAREGGVKTDFFHPRHFTTSALPDIPPDFDYFCALPPPGGRRAVGHPLRRILRAARYPVLVPAPVFTPWQRITVFCGGSANAVNACRLGLHLAQRSCAPLDVFTLAEGRDPQEYRRDLAKAGLAETGLLDRWQFIEARTIEEALRTVVPDALVVMGAFGHGSFLEFIRGSKLKKALQALPNSLLIAGPRYAAGI